MIVNQVIMSRGHHDTFLFLSKANKSYNDLIHYLEHDESIDWDRLQIVYLESLIHNNRSIPAFLTSCPLLLTTNVDGITSGKRTYTGNDILNHIPKRKNHKRRFRAENFFSTTKDGKVKIMEKNPNEIGIGINHDKKFTGIQDMIQKRREELGLTNYQSTLSSSLTSSTSSSSNNTTTIIPEELSQLKRHMKKNQRRKKSGYQRSFDKK